MEEQKGIGFFSFSFDLYIFLDLNLTIPKECKESTSSSNFLGKQGKI